MKTLLSLTLLLIASLPVSSFAQGSLNPTAAPRPTMKSLDQIEPRTLISSLPYTISQPGAYYLTQNLAVPASTAGITVNNSNVTIDLNGFGLYGGGGGFAGITVSTGFTHLVVRNGTISGWSKGAISAIDANFSTYENLNLSSNSGGANTAALQAGFGCIIRRCDCFNNGGSIPTAFFASANSVFTECVADGSGFSVGSSLVSNCIASDNFSGDGIQIISGKVQHCFASANSGNGISGTGIVVDCSTVGNSLSGISVGSGSSVQGCNSASNGAAGIVATTSCSLTGNTCSSNTTNGISFSSKCSVSGNNCSGNNTTNNNTNAGIVATGYMNTIDSNTCSSNGNGLGISTPTAAPTAPTTRNIIIRNSCAGNTGGNYQVGSSAYGPTINMTGGGEISSASGTVNPWTNWIH